MLFLLSKPEAAAAILGVEYPPPIPAANPRPGASTAKLSGPKVKKIAASFPQAGRQLVNAPSHSAPDRTAVVDGGRGGFVPAQASGAAVTMETAAAIPEVCPSMSSEGLESRIYLPKCRHKS